MKKILSIAHYTFIENIRNRMFYVIVLFGVIITVGSLLIAALGGEQPQRIVLDLGLGAIEFFALVTVGFSAVTLILEEMESKTIYLVLTRPVSRMAYLTGRFLGLLASVYAGMLVMALVHVLVLLFKGWDFPLRYILALFMSAGKITIMGALALLVSLFSSSAVSSISFMIFFWILGHFSEEIGFLSGKLPLVPRLVGKAVYYILPNMQYFNLRDFWNVPEVGGIWIPAAFVYSTAYSLFCLGLAVLLFKKKEF